MKLYYSELKEVLKLKLVKYGFLDENAGQLSDIFTGNTFDGVFSHGINRFPLFIHYVERGIVKVENSPDKINSFGAFEQWDGKLGAGILNALHCADRVLELA